MYSIFSKDGSFILTFDGEDEEPNQLTLQEFIERYGEEMLPGRVFYVEDVVAPDVVSSVNELEDRMHYWASLSRLCKACGEYSRVNSLLLNETFETPLSQLDNYQKLEKRRETIFRLESERAAKELRAKACAKNFSYWHQRLGFQELKEVDRNFLIKYLYDGDFRKRMYRRIRKYKAAHELISLNEIVREIFRSFAKQNRLPVH